MSDELDSSELGTQEYWDKRYKMEIDNFRSHGDVGEVWFGEDCIDRIIYWLDKSEWIGKDDSILDIGCGNGMTLIELSSNDYTNLTGYDYSSDAISLAKEIAIKHKCSVKYYVKDILEPVSTRNDDNDDALTFKMVHDKGTYDAISLSENSKQNRSTYIDNIYKMLNDKGIYIITSCNWTQDELVEHFKEKFKLTSIIPTPQFKFGGKVGNVVTSIVLQKKFST